MNADLVANGKLCITTAVTVYNRLISGSGRDVENAMTQLVALKDIVKSLQQFAEAAKGDCEYEFQEMKDKMDELSMEQVGYEIEVIKLNKSRLSAEARRKMIKDSLLESEKELAREKDKLYDAECDLQSAREEEDSVANKAANVGRIAGMVAFLSLELVSRAAFGKGVGEAIGSGIGDLINKAEGKVASAEDRLSRKREDVNRQREELSEINDLFFKIDAKIHAIKSSISHNKDQIKSIHNGIGFAKKSLDFHMQAVDLWESFTQAAESTTFFVERLKQIVSRATKKENLQIMKKNGKVIEVNSFLEAWEEISEKGRLLPSIE